MADFRKGPWIEGDHGEIQTASGEVVALVVAGTHSEANSRLICSAPMMHDTMVEAVKVAARWAADEDAASEVALKDIVDMLIVTLEVARHKVVAIRPVIGGE
jgi:hypothetical protein